MVHWEAEDCVGEPVRLGEVLACGGGEAAVCGELADEREEVSAAEHVGLPHLEVQLVACPAEFLSVDEYREV